MRAEEIYFKDITEEAQDHTLVTLNTTMEDENWDIVPLAIIEREDNDGQT